MSNPETPTEDVLKRHHVKARGRTCDAILMNGEGTFQCTRRDKHDEHEAFDGAQIVEKWRDEDGE